VPETALVELGGLRLYAIHDLAQLDIDPVAAGVRVVVSGHSHRPRAEERGGVLYLNPGSAGPRRFKLPISAAELLIDDGAPTSRIVELVTG
jgi:predicted phosphodiesterase